MTLNIEDVDELKAPEPERPRTPGAKAPSKPFWRRPWILPLFAITVFWLYMQIEPVAGVPEDQLQIPPHENFPAYYPLLITHMAFGTVTVLTVCLQLWPWLRINHPKWHRVSGRLYIVGAVVAAISGLIIVWWAPIPGQLGGAAMLLFWLGITTAAYVTVRRRNYVLHRRFMLYSFAVPANNFLAFFTYLAIDKFQIQVDFAYFLEYARWVPWVLNLMLIQAWLYHTEKRPVTGPSAVRSRR